MDRPILHEFAHQRASNHLSEECHEALGELGAKLKAAALREPAWFAKYITNAMTARSD